MRAFSTYNNTKRGINDFDETATNTDYFLGLPSLKSTGSFTGKERDAETGYGYFGARYMDHDLMSLWLSVDPMADKYPSISPYAYCAWNPVRLVDPDGRDVEIIKDDQKKSVTIRANFYYSKKDIGKDAEVFIKGFTTALESWQNDIVEALKDESLSAENYSVLFEFGFTECDNPKARATNDCVGNWI